MNQKVVLITGASAGIGMATAEKLTLKGHIVYAAARRVSLMNHLKAQGVKIMEMDVTNDFSMENGIQQIIDEQGRIDVLINNAGYGSLGAVEEVSIDEARRQFEVNLFGAARLCQLVLPHMRKAGKGRIINVSSIGARVYEPLCAWYHSTKFAIEGLSDCMRLEVKSFGVDVVLVQPGFVRTEWAEIAHESLLRFSTGGPYQGIASKLVKAHLNYLFRYFASDAPVIANTLVHVVEARKPRPRYASGKASRLFLFTRKILFDKWLDALFMFMLHRFGRSKNVTLTESDSVFSGNKISKEIA